MENNTNAKDNAFSSNLNETAKGDAELGMYLDLSLYKKIGNDDPKKVANTNGTVTITIKVPTKLVNKDSGVTRTYQIVRVHNGKAEVINCKYDAKAGTITFKTDKFSTYALVYKDTAKSTGTNTNTNTIVILPAPQETAVPE